MQKDKKFFSFNKIRDFQKCSYIDMLCDDRGCKLSNTPPPRNGLMILKPLDSHEKGMVWDRIAIDLDMPPECKISGYFIATDDTNLYDAVRDPSTEAYDKIALLKKQAPQHIPNVEHALLHEYQGRYLMGWLTIYAAADSPVIRRIRIHYPKESYLDYLPGIYSHNEHSDFLHRYLSIYRTILNELEEAVDLSPKNLLSQMCGMDEVWWLAEGLGLESPEIWDLEQLQDRVQKAIALGKIRGTKSSLKEISQFITKKSCYIIEQHNLKRDQMDAQQNGLYDQLYGSHYSDFTVIVPDDGLADERKYNQMKKAVDTVKPAFSKAKIVSLQPYTRLDQHTYLGINSNINKPGALVLDNRSALPYNTVLTNHPERKMNDEE